MKLIYKFIHRFYNCLDILYFKKNNQNPSHIVLSHIPKENGSVLDMCTGTGRNAIAIAAYNLESKVIGIDISKDMLGIAKKRIMKQNIQNIELLVMDAGRTKFEDNSFDVVLISLVLHELNEKYATKIINEAKRLLKEKGEIIVVEWEKETKLFRKIMFFPIKMLEPKGFEMFIEGNMYKYFEKFDLKVEEIIHCDYSQVMLIRK